MFFALARTSLFYHSRFDLSRTFFKFFQIFSTALDFVPPSRTALIYYHRPNYLSSTKFKVFSFIFQGAICSIFPAAGVRYAALPDPAAPAMASWGKAAIWGFESHHWTQLVEGDREDRPYIIIWKQKKTAHFRVRPLKTKRKPRLFSRGLCDGVICLPG